MRVEHVLIVHPNVHENLDHLLSFAKYDKEIPVIHKCRGEVVRMEGRIVRSRSLEDRIHFTPIAVKPLNIRGRTANS